MAQIRLSANSSNQQISKTNHMETTITREPGRVTVTIEGRVDTATSAELNEVLAPLSQETGIELVLDCENMDYISSSGLRVLLGTQNELSTYTATLKLPDFRLPSCGMYGLAKAITANAGSLVVKNVQDSVKSVFDITGFSSFLDIR